MTPPTFTITADSPVAVQVVAHARRLSQVTGLDTSGPGGLDELLAAFQAYRAAQGPRAETYGGERRVRRKKNEEETT
jgi:hypothetical protein